MIIKVDYNWMDIFLDGCPCYIAPELLNEKEEMERRSNWPYRQFATRNEAVIGSDVQSVNFPCTGWHWLIVSHVHSTSDLMDKSEFACSSRH